MKQPPVRLIVFIWFLLSLSIFYSGHLYSNDTVSKVESARNFIKNGSFSVSGYNGAWGIPVPGDTTYPHFSLGSILIMVPPVACYEILSAVTSNKVPVFIEKIFISASNLLYTALSGTLFFILLIRLEKSNREAFISANCLVFCSEMLQYSSTGWSEPSAFFFGLMGFVAILCIKSGDKITPYKPWIDRAWILWAFCVMIASLIRLEYIVFFLLFLFFNLWSDKTQWKKYLIPFFIICLNWPFHFWFNLYRFGSLFNFGYFGEGTENAATGISSVFSLINGIMERFISINNLKTLYWTYLSFGRVHWFWVCPLLALSPFAFFKKNKHHFIDRIFFSALIFQIVIVAMGSNSWCWANRYMYTSFAYLTLPVFFIKREYSGLKKSVLYLSIVGLIISLFSTLINYHYVQELAVSKYGYSHAMWGTSNHVFGAMIWSHMAFFPEQLINTVKLIFTGNNPWPWEIVRVKCLDIWPVGMCGAGINSIVSFGLWAINVGVFLLFGIKWVKPELICYHNLKK